MTWRDGNWGWWLFMPVVMVAFWAAVIWAIATIARGRPHASPRRATPRRSWPSAAGYGG